MQDYLHLIRPLQHKLNELKPLHRFRDLRKRLLLFRRHSIHLLPMTLRLRSLLLLLRLLVNPSQVKRSLLVRSDVVTLEEILLDPAA